MGYELHVKRLVEGGEVEDITEDEWFRFVDDAVDFELEDESPTGGASSHEQVVMKGSFGCWTGHPTARTVPFRWSHGAVHVAFADDHVVVGALRIADAFEASVVGDEGETYVEPLDRNRRGSSRTTANSGQIRFHSLHRSTELSRRSRACRSTSTETTRCSHACVDGSADLVAADQPTVSRPAGTI